MNRDRTIENNVLEFLRSLPKDMLFFPFNIYKASESITNCKIHTYQEFAASHGVSLGEIFSFCESETGCVIKEGNHYIIMYNDASMIVRERKSFTLAHEVGHILCGHFDGSTNKLGDKSAEASMEREANQFAACLLCPMPIVRSYQPKSRDELRAMFGLSGEASDIAWLDYKRYDRGYNIGWHNAMLRLYSGAS